MKSSHRARWSVAAVLLLTPLLSCPKEQPQVLFIADAAALTRQTQCMIRPGATPQFIWMNGVLDLAITNVYWLYPHVHNMLPTLGESTQEGPTGLYPTETNYVNLHTAYVHVNLGEFYSTLFNPEEGALAESYRLDGFTWDVAGSIPPASEGVVAVQVIPPDLGNFLAKKILSKPGAKSPGIWISTVVRLEGRTQDLWTVYSNEFKFPIQVCFGCLIRPTTNDPSQPPSAANIPCNPGQDEGVDDTLCRLIALHKDACFPSD